MFTRHTLDVQPSVLNCECSSWTASISDGFHCSVSSCSLPVVGQFSYIWNDQHTSEQHNKENSLSTSICAFSWHADSRKRNTPTVAWFQASNAVWMRSALFSDFTQRRLVVSCRRFAKTVDGCEILTAVLVKIQVIKDVSPFRLVKLPSSSGSTVQNSLRSTETSVTLHQSTGRNLKHLCENVTSHRIEDRAGPPIYCVWCVFYGSVKIIATFTEAPYWTYFSFRALSYTKTPVNTNKCTIMQSVYSFYYMQELTERIHRLYNCAVINVIKNIFSSVHTL